MSPPVTPLRVVFAGTPELAATVLAALLDDGHHRVVAVYTQPDRPAGRGRRPSPSPVKRLALARGLPVRQPHTLRDDAAVAALAGLAPDVVAVAAYGLLLPAAALAVPRLGCINVHASLLPRWRGAAPVQRALLAGDRVTGVSIMRMVEALDAGPVLERARCPIEDTDTAGSLYAKLAPLGARLLLRTLDALAAGTARAQEQEHASATYAPKIDKSEAVLDWGAPALELERKVRAFDPAPVARAELAGDEVRIWQARALPGGATDAPGCVLAARPEGIDVATGQGILRITRLQRPGRRPVSAAEYVNARRDWGS